MSTAVLDRIREERDQARSAALAMAEADEFKPEDPTFLDLQKRAEELDKRAETLAGLLQKREAADALDGKLARAAKRTTDKPTGGSENTESLGDTFVRSDVFTGYTGRGTSSRLDVEVRALPLTTSGFGSLGAPQQILNQPPSLANTLLSLLPRIQVSTNSVELVVMAATTGDAAVVPEGSPKPPVEYAPTVTPVTLDTIAVYTQLTRQLIEDLPAVRDFINTDLQRLVARKQDQLANQAFTSATLPTAAGDDLLTAIRVGLGTVQAAGFDPSGVVLNPADYAALDVTVFGSTLLGPSVSGSFWGLRAIASSAQAAGTAIVGDFSAGSALFARNSIQVFVSDSHADTFTSNVFTLLAETRSKAVVRQPAAFCECSGPVTP